MKPAAVRLAGRSIPPEADKPATGTAAASVKVNNTTGCEKGVGKQNLGEPPNKPHAYLELELNCL